MAVNCVGHFPHPENPPMFIKLTLATIVSVVVLMVLLAVFVV